MYIYIYIYMYMILYIYIYIYRLHVSGMRRARETADIIASKLPAEAIV